MPFWKLCTIGASDYLMPEREIGWGRKANRRNEYMMLISPDVDIRNPSDDEDVPTDWLSLNSLLWATAEYAFNEKDNITFQTRSIWESTGNTAGRYSYYPKYSNRRVS